MKTEEFVNLVLPPVGSIYSAFSARKKLFPSKKLSQENQQINKVNYEIQRNAAIAIGIQTGICGVVMGLHNMNPIFDKFFTLNHLKGTGLDDFEKLSGVKDLDGMVLAGVLGCDK